MIDKSLAERDADIDKMCTHIDKDIVALGKEVKEVKQKAQVQYRSNVSYQSRRDSGCSNSSLQQIWTWLRICDLENHSLLIKWFDFLNLFQYQVFIRHKRKSFHRSVKIPM